MTRLFKYVETIRERPLLNPFVTLSASHGASGSEIGPALAAQLGVPFFDRAIPAMVADRLHTSVDDPILREERPAGFLERLLASFAAVAPLYEAAGMALGVPDILSEQEYRAEVDRVIRGAGDGAAGGVLLGRAGAVVLADHPRILHVRLDAPPARRIQRLCQQLGIEETRASQELRDNDAAREAYVKQLYEADANNPRLYHLIIDSTSIPISTCVDVIAAAAHARSQEPSTAIN